MPTLSYIGRNRLISRCSNCDRQLSGILKGQMFLGQNHPYYSSSLYNLASIYQAIGRNQEADRVLSDCMPQVVEITPFDLALG
jgi:lipopolysaccharide biosynthesis regulator YciM